MAALTMSVSADAANLSGLGNVAVGPHGEIAIGQPQDGGIRLFSSGGKFLRMIGRAGEGPGEFRRLGFVRWIGDTIVVPDETLRRFTRFSAEGKLLGVLPWPPLPPEVARSKGRYFRIVSATPVAVYSDGSFLSRALWNVRTPAGIAPNFGKGAVSLAMDGRLLRVVVEEAGSHACELEQNGTSINIPFCQSEERAFSGDGLRIAYARLIDARGGGLKIRVTSIASSGDTVFVADLPFSPKPILAAFADSVRQYLVEHASRPEYARLYRSMTLPKVFPPIARMLVGRDESTWVEIAGGAETHEWIVLDQKGEDVGHLVLPVRTQIQEAQLGMIWTLEEEDTGLMGIGSYRLTKR